MQQELDLAHLVLPDPLSLFSALVDKKVSPLRVELAPLL